MPIKQFLVSKLKNLFSKFINIYSKASNLFHSPKSLHVPPPRTASGKSKPNCNFPSKVGLKTLPGIDSSTTGGFFSAPKIFVKASVKMQLTSTLYLFAKDEIRIAGIINNADKKLNAPVNLYLVCAKGSIFIEDSSEIGSPFWGGHIGLPLKGQDDKNSAPSALAQSGPGMNAGIIKIMAVGGAIEIKGKVTGFNGGNGGEANAKPRMVTKPRTTVGHAVAVGGQGGAGGDVILCSLDGISIAGSGEVRGGHGGFGGDAIAKAINGGDTVAVGGPGNVGGDVIFVGLQQGMMFRNENDVGGGGGGPGTFGDAWGGNVIGKWGKGGGARAYAHPAGNGGTVKFKNCACDPQVVGNFFAARGGSGCNCNAWGGTGGDGNQWLIGSPGGDAKSTGGTGGRPGAIPVIPLDPTGTVQGTIESTFHGGSGGGAVAMQGTGGKGRPGGCTGTAKAQGGMSGNTGQQPPEKTLPPFYSTTFAYGPGVVGQALIETGAIP